MFSVNNLVVCTPLEKPFNETVTVGKKGLLVANKTNNILEPVTVLLDAEILKDGSYSTIRKGSTIYVSGDFRANKNATTKQKCRAITQEVEVDGKKVNEEVEFVLVPFDMIRLVDEHGE